LRSYKRQKDYSSNLAHSFVSKILSSEHAIKKVFSRKENVHPNYFFFWEFLFSSLFELAPKTVLYQDKLHPRLQKHDWNETEKLNKKSNLPLNHSYLPVECMCVCVRERELECFVCMCVCVRERESACVSVCVWERERKRVCVCDWENS